MRERETKRLVLTEIPSMPRAVLRFVSIFPPVTSGKAIPVGHRGTEGERKKEREEKLRE